MILFVIGDCCCATSIFFLNSKTGRHGLYRPLTLHISINTPCFEQKMLGHESDPMYVKYNLGGGGVLMWKVEGNKVRGQSVTAAYVGCIATVPTTLSPTPSDLAIQINKS